MSVQLVIKHTANKTEFTVSIDRSATVAELKEHVGGKAEIPKDNIRLVCAGRIWQDNCTVDSYAPKEGAIVHCLSSAPKPAAAAGIASTASLQATDPMTQMMGGMGSMPALSPAAASGDPMAQMMAQSQAMMEQNPEMMQQMMESPMVQQMLSNPETVRAMMRMNPQMNQLMEQQPEIARMMEDPDVMRQAMDMMRNPSLRREMTRNQDLAIGNLDAMTGGHQALVNAHQQVLDPMYNALSGSGNSGNTQVSEETLAAYAAQTAGSRNTQSLANPWGAPTPTAPSSQPSSTSAPTANPMAGMMQMMNAPNSGGMGAPAAGTNPMESMMQQMMQNPAMMQQSMQMAQQMFGGAAAGANADTSAMTNPMAAMMQQMNTQSNDGAVPSPGGAGGNPMQAMMQQMMQNPAMMQQSMQMAQQMFGGGLGGSNTEANANPMAAMMQQMNTQSNDGAVPSPSGAGGNPMQAMMQQMMQNPAMMQQSMQMAQQMFGGGLGGSNTDANANPMAALMQQSMNPPTSAAAPVNAEASTAAEGQEPASAMTNAPPPLMPTLGMLGANPGVNPMQAIMQQRMQALMANPELLAQRQAQARAMFGGGYPGFQMPPFAPAAQPFDGGSAQANTEVSADVNRVRFASQLAQLATMGFSNEALCLQALARTNGRVDAAIDALLSENA